MSYHINRFSQLDIEIIIQVIKILHSRNDNDSGRKHVSIINTCLTYHILYNVYILSQQINKLSAHIFLRNIPITIKQYLMFTFFILR